MRFFKNPSAKVVNVRDRSSFRKRDGEVGSLFFRPFFAGFYSRSGQFSRRSRFLGASHKASHGAQIDLSKFMVTCR